jgi:hypothetical protein
MPSSKRSTESRIAAWVVGFLIALILVIAIAIALLLVDTSASGADW